MRLPSAPAGDGVAQTAGEPVEDGGAEQEVADLVGLPGEDLVGEVVDDEPVAAGERLDEVRRPRSCSRMPRSESAASCRPAIQPSVRSSSASTSAAVRSQPHHLVEELHRLGGVKRRSAARTSVSWPRLRSRARGSGGSERVAITRCS